MRIKNVDLTKTNLEVCIIPRKSGNIVFKCVAVLNYEDFDKLCPRPEPPTILRPGLSPKKDYENKAFIKKDEDWYEKKQNYMMMKSLLATDGLSWDKAKAGDPETWCLVREEFDAIALTEAERMRLEVTVMKANGLSGAMVEEAEDDFLELQAEKV